MSLNLFPARVAIGKVAAGNGQSLDVIMTSEFARALTDLFERVGGADGMSNDDLALLGSFSVADGLLEQDQHDAAVRAALAAPVPVFAADPPPFEESASVFALLDEMRARINDLEKRFLDSSPAVESELFKTKMALEIQNAFSPTFVPDWERPGKIGRAKASTGSFTTLAASGRISANLGLTVAGGTFISRGITDNATATALTFTAAGIASYGSTIQYFDEQVNIVGADTKLALRSSAGYTWGISNEGVTNAGKLTFRYEDGALDVWVLDRLGNGVLNGAFTAKGGAAFMTTNTTLSSFAGAAAGTLTNAPTAGNPTKWIAINDNGTSRYIPTWT